MFLDAEQREEGWFANQVFDVCIIGAGPAGITLARRLARHGHSIVILEAGQREFTENSQSVYQGEVTGAPYYPLDATRLRHLGGSSNHWAGWCRPLDAYDFLAKSHVPISGWPISKTDLDPYAAETDEILGLPASVPPEDTLAKDAYGLKKIRYRWSNPPVRFGEKYADELSSVANITICLNANVIDVVLNDSRRSVVAVKATAYERKGVFEVRARYFCLCMGGIENPRLLLNSDSQIVTGIGNHSGLVGRYFAEHMQVSAGELLIQNATDGFFLAPTPEFMAQTGTSNFAMELKIYRSPTTIRSTLRNLACLSSFTEQLAQAVLARRIRCERSTDTLIITIEQALNPESRLTLSRDTDQFGLRRLALDWRFSQIDADTIYQATLATGQLLAEQKLARVKLPDWMRERAPAPTDLAGLVWGGNHHMCTTRMSENPNTGVVNRDCRVHQTENLYIGGSSVFATGGHATPTYTIVQLALRLADHLSDRLDRR